MEAEKDLIKFIHDISMKPQFKGKIFLLENYNMELSKHLVSGVDVWLKIRQEDQWKLLEQVDKKLLQMEL